MAEKHDNLINQLRKDQDKMKKISEHLNSSVQSSLIEQEENLAALHKGIDNIREVMKITSKEIEQL